MYILGLSCFYHDSSAALLKDGVIVAAAEEERFTRKKHDHSFPINAVNYCLQSQGIAISDVSYIGFYEKPLLKFERLLFQYIETFPLGWWSFSTTLPSWFSQKLRLVKIVNKKLKYKKGILFIPHHLAHAASAFLVSPFEKAAILTIDGVGEWSTTTYGVGEKNKIESLKHIQFPHSLGLLYSTITAYLGFRANNCEYKIMGLSAYGEKDKSKNPYYAKLKQVLDIKEDGSFCLDMNYFSYCHAQKMPSRKLCKLLNGPITKKGDELTQRHKNIAAALQIITEEAIIKILNHLHQIAACDNVVLAGGVALNSVCNGKILRNTLFKNVWIQPNASDGGTSIGVAAFIYHNILNYPRTYRMENSYLGPDFSREEIKLFLDKNQIKYRELDEKELIKTVAQLIFDNKIVGWFQGQMEWGPRALGNRSILANPLNPEMKDIINSRIKHREFFRPFAPAVCQEDTLKYFDCDSPLPEPTKYMLMVYPAKKEWANKLQSVVNIDETARLQAVDNKQNHLFYKLIREFEKLSGVPILLNTSFNANNEPIVCSPKDAHDCFIKTGLDHLVMGSFLLDNPTANDLREN